MRVVARSVGYFDVWREPGDQFEIQDSSQLGSWMEAVDAPNKPQRRGRPPKDSVQAVESVSVIEAPAVEPEIESDSVL